MLTNAIALSFPFAEVRSLTSRLTTLCQLELESEKALEHLTTVEKKIKETTIVSEDLRSLVERFTRQVRDEQVAAVTGEQL
jgi:hypothetical protein